MGTDIFYKWTSSHNTLLMEFFPISTNSKLHINMWCIKKLTFICHELIVMTSTSPAALKRD